MTCEVCGKSQMNVATYNIQIIAIKLDACTQCIRDIDIMMENEKIEFCKTLRHRVVIMMDDNRIAKQNEAAKKSGS
jgi:hypothetical protein